MKIYIIIQDNLTGNIYNRLSDEDEIYLSLENAKKAVEERWAVPVSIVECELKALRIAKGLNKEETLEIGSLQEDN